MGICLPSYYLLPVPEIGCAKKARSAYGDNFQPLVVKMTELLTQRASPVEHILNILARALAC